MAMNCAIAIVGMACRFPDADTPAQLFVNALAQRRAFRKIPAVRLGAGYFESSGTSVDRAYMRQAAVLKGFRFDRELFRVSTSSYQVTDLAHWLALTVARDAIADVRFRGTGNHPGNDAVRVVVGNTLTGEFSRANLMRLRWPYVRRVVAGQLDDEELRLGADARERFLRDLEHSYKSAFPVPNEDFLAGGLANTIAGRICNHFDFKGGGYTVDGACSSSLLAVIDACSALASGDADMVLAGGVDLSLDPFELVGFSRSSALARRDMTVYDETSDGFWPGEGCGFVVLMRYDDALRQCENIHAVIRGWGVSSDGRGGLTRPESHGQMLALQRCYARAGFGIESVGYFEGHGTGTKVGDAAELRALMTCRRASGAPLHPAVISSIKANIGHTKAAAGLAGLLRATACVAEAVLPPATACRRPHALLREDPGNITTLDRPRQWEAGDVPRRAGVSAMGFGGINTHVVIEQAPENSAPQARTAPPDLARLQRLQDAELLLFAAPSRDDLAWTIAHVAGFADACSMAELTDLAAELARRATRGALSPWKAAVVAATPSGLDARLAVLQRLLADLPDEGVSLSMQDGVFVSGSAARGTIALAFPGQGAPARQHGGAHARRFACVEACYRHAGLEAFTRIDDTDFAQAAIATASLAGLAMLDVLGVSGDVAIGHSLGELAALHWAECYDADALLAIAKARGQAMAADRTAAGAMAAFGADRDTMLAAVAGRANLYVANVNAPRQTVVAGDATELGALLAEMRRAGIAGTALRVRQAFHTPAMRSVAEPFASVLRHMRLQGPRRKVVSTVTAAVLEDDIDVARYLCEQLVAPVEFLAASRTACDEADLIIEVGPGDILTGLIGGFSARRAVSLDVGGESLAGLLHAAGAAYVLGRAPAIGALFEDRFAKRFDWSWRPKFFENPCEAGATDEAPADEPAASPHDAEVGTAQRELHGETRERLRQIVAERTGLPAWTLLDGSRMLSDLHLNSITVGEIVTRLVSSMRLPAPIDPTEFADASIGAIAEALDALRESPAPGSADLRGTPAGLGSWVRPFEMRLVPAAQGEVRGDLPHGGWDGFGVLDGDRASLLARLNAEPHGCGVVVWLERADDEDGVAALLHAAQRCTMLAQQGRDDLAFVVIQQGWSASGFAKSFFIEHGSIRTLVVDVAPMAHVRLVERILDEIDRGPNGFAEIFLGPDGARATMRVVPATARTASDALPVGAADIVLVSGGGGGISAECARELAQRTGCALLIIGRSLPHESPQLTANIVRLQAGGVRLSYQPADVTAADAVRSAVARGCAALGGPVTAIIHGAGVNVPQRIVNLSVENILSTLRPKVTGFHNLIAAIEPRQLKLVATFSSIIARIGLHGEADYALANDWLSRVTEEFQAQHPGCRCRAIEWSVWSGVGMGQRLGRQDMLAAAGIAPISIDDGVRAFIDVIQSPDLPVRVIVSGRFGRPATLALDLPQPPRLRFIETVPVDYPRIELIAECRISRRSDPYLDDHALDGERLLPAVMALEALAQAARTLLDEPDAVPDFTDVRFRQAIVVPADPGEEITLRLVALADRDGTPSFAVRCSTTAFQVNHIEAHGRLRTNARNEADAGDIACLAVPEIGSFDSGRSLYGKVLFQRGRFQRVRAFHVIEARRCVVSLALGGGVSWFAQGLPYTCLLGDPGARDAALHAIQASIPHHTVIPVAVDAIECGVIESTQSYRVVATEVADRGEHLVWDIAIVAEDGGVAERWRGLNLRIVKDTADFRLDCVELAAPYFERRIAAAMPQAGLTVRVARAELGARPRPGAAAHHRPDGRPEPENGARFRSVSYGAGWKLTTDADGPVGCDLQEVPSGQGPDWRVLLGEQDVLTAEAIAGRVGEPVAVSATRIWTTREALKKAGLPPAAPLAIDPDSTRSWVMLGSGVARVFSSTIERAPSELSICVAVAVLTADRATG